MIPFYRQQAHQRSTGPRYGYRQQSIFDCGNNMSMNWQHGNWSGGYDNGRQVPIQPQPPPFFYRNNTDNSHMPYTEGSSNYNRQNQVEHINQGLFQIPRTPRRGILKKTGSKNVPTQRRLVHFMPEQWQEPKTNTNDYSNSNILVRSERKKNDYSSSNIRSKKTPEKAHRDTIRRRDRRQKYRRALQTSVTELGRLNDNRFILLSDQSENDERETETDNDLSEIDDNQSEADKKAMKTFKRQYKDLSNKRKNNNRRQANTTTEVPITGEHVVKNIKVKTYGNNQRQVYETEDEYTTLSESENEQGYEKSSSNMNRYKSRTKSYLQDFKILAYIKQRMNSDRKIKLELKDALNAACAYARNTIEAYDKWVYNNYEAQVWQKIYDLGQQDNHWAKELVNLTHTRDTNINVKMCEKKISQLTSACFDANSIINRNMREFASDSSIPTASVATKRVHELLLDYIKEATDGLSKMSINRIRRATIEKDEWTALQAFENIATEQQKMYAKTFLRPVIKMHHKKKKNLELVAAHISKDIIPKILPQFDFNLPLDERSLTGKQIKENKESIHKLSKDFRLKATELYLKIAKDEYDFQEEKLRKLLEDFPSDRDEVPLTQMMNNHDVDDSDKEPIEDDDDDIRPFTQRPLTQRPLAQRSLTQKVVNAVDKSASDLFSKYKEIADKRNSIETEYELHFLAESGVEETPIVIQETQDLNLMLRKDFMLQI